VTGAKTVKSSVAAHAVALMRAFMLTLGFDCLFRGLGR
jgi:hypothetical protein